MKHHALKWAGIITILAFLAVSCGGNDDPPPGIDRSGLGAAIGAAQAMLADTDIAATAIEVHQGRYWTTAAERTAFQSAIASAQSTYANPAATQGMLNAAATAMRDATGVFDDAREPGMLPLDQVSRAGLNAAISDATALIANTEVAANGANLQSTVFWATQAAHTTFQAAITAAAAVHDNADSTQPDVNTARGTLIAAHGVFDTARSPGTLDPQAGFLGLPPVRLSGQVYTITWPDAFSAPIYTPSTVNTTVTSGFLGLPIGTITNGILDATLDTPTSLTNIEDSTWFEDLEVEHNNVTASNPAAQIAVMFLYTSDPNGDLYRQFTGGTLANLRGDWVQFIYVSADVTITGTGGTFTETYDGITYTVTTQDFSLPLRQGWNAVHSAGTVSYNFTAGTATANESLHHRNPGPPVRWVHSVWRGGNGFADSLDLPVEPAMQEQPGRASRWLGGRR